MSKSSPRLEGQAMNKFSPATRAYRADIEGKSVTVHLPASTTNAKAKDVFCKRFGKDRVKSVSKL